VVSPNYERNFGHIFKVTNTRTRVKVVWQDGTRSEFLNSTQLVPRLNVLDTDFWPEDVITLRGKKSMD